MIGYLGDVTLIFHLGMSFIPIQAGFHGIVSQTTELITQ